jgi:pimeloyl-ACP methyl ester carboxylesterase
MTIGMNPARVDTLKVPGASLYYEVRGSGPVLLMIPGGPADAGVFAGIAPILADRYTVVTYDPRGNSRSSFDGPLEDWRAEVHADDASRLLAAVGTGPAYVFGSSGGALVGLALVARHPEQVRTLIAHEPPAMELLPDREQRRAAAQEIYDTYRREGVGPAMAKFLAGAGLKPAPPPQGEPTPEMAEMMGRMGRNVDLFVAHGIRQIGAYVPDTAALRQGSTRVVVAGGEASRGQPAYEASAVLADRLGTTVVHFPGDHGGFGSHPAAFAETLHKVLRDR